ncbi:porin family protein [Neisseria sp. ZJ106]|uniref:Outer membrane beta-barrel protein n=1 Tax=Neisseria lisongii TaxID=2912188 RepID=A0AAW5AL59_9NEIS|nr:outer membrane beta-barrel protein [Neisseria lisongii]MCF7521973.1 porin family protein [Neisseria lisongii]MCF7530578.1 porin family protein [Neisseria lisongii]WCL71347.1 outer membrane beta-barrel protein [Neisseria lisongii]
MKKTALTVFLLAATAAASAAPALNQTGNFTGAGIEIGAGAAKSDVKHIDGNEKTKADAAIRGSYNVQLGNSDWISGGEVSVKPLHRTVSSTAAGDVKQKADVGVSYVQGYRLTNDVMAYGKVGYHYGRFTGAGDKNLNGVGYGAGVKYAVAPNVEAGLDWEQTRYKKSDTKINNNSYMATIGYRF